MRRRTPLVPAVLAMALAAAFGAGCQSQAAPRATASPAPTPTPVVALQPPSAAILADADVGLPRTAGNDRLSLEEAAASAPDQVLALQQYRGWGWSAAASRTWAGGGARVDDLVLASDREEGARRAYGYLAQQAALAPMAAGPCPAAIAGLDACTLGAAGARTVVVGRLATKVFVLDVTGRDAVALASNQARRLRAT